MLFGSKCNICLLFIDKGISVSGVFAIDSDKLVVDALATQQSSVVFYNVIVSASDGGHPKKSTLGVIRVNIQVYFVVDVTKQCI